MNFSKAVVTGSEGFIGGHLVDELLSMGVMVLGIDDLSSGLESTLEHHLKSKNYISRPISVNDQRVSLVLEKFKPDVVFHLAAKAGVVSSVLDPAFTDFVNVNGSVNMLEAARLSGVKRFVFSSSSSVYGGATTVPTSEAESLKPMSPYALQKKIGEEYCRLFSEIYDIDTVCLRYFNVFGPRQRFDSAYAAVISSFCNNVKNNERPVIFGDGEQYRDFCPVENIVNANILASKFEGSLNGEAFNVGCGKKTTINELAALIGAENPIYKDARPGDVFGSHADIGKIKNIINYDIVMPFKTGIENTIRWYLK